MATLRRAYGRKAPGKRFIRTASSPEVGRPVAKPAEASAESVVVDPPKKKAVAKSSNVIIPEENDVDDVPSLDKFMNIAHQDNMIEEDAEVEEPVKSSVEQIIDKTEQVEVEDSSSQVFESTDKPAEEPEEVTEPAEVKQVFAEEPKPVVKEVSPVKAKVITEADKFDDDPLADETKAVRPGKKSSKKKTSKKKKKTSKKKSRKQIDDPLAD